MDPPLPGGGAARLPAVPRLRIIPAREGSASYHGLPGRAIQMALVMGCPKGEMVLRKVLMFATALGAGWLLYTQRQDIIRYAKIKQMSMGDGHPGNVPAGGSQSYPKA